MNKKMPFFQNKKHKLFLVLILLLAAFLRFYQLEKVPPGFHIDEVTVGYNAYSLMETGKDENGNLLPLYIDSFGDFRPAGYFYLTIPSVMIFGVNEFAVRFPSVFFGILTVLLVFFLVEEIFQKRFVSFLSSFLLAISPWHIVVSRATSESSVALFLIVLGTYLFLLGIKKEKIKYFLLSFLSFFLSFFVYHSPRVFVPLLAFGFLGLSWRKLKTKRAKTLVVGFLIACLITSLLVIFLSQGAGRFKQVSIFNHPGVQLRLNEQIREEKAGISIFLVRAFHNKAVNYGLETLSNYGKHFSFDFLFIKGGLPIRYLVPEAGLLYLIELPFLLIGIFLVLKSKKDFPLLFIYWMLIGPVAASLTFEDIPNIQRAFFVLPSFQVLTAYGFYQVYKILKKERLIKNLLISGSLLFLIFNFSYFFHQYLVHQRAYRPWNRNYGFKELISVLNELDIGYDQIVLTKAPNDPYIYILFYNRYDPSSYHQYAPRREKDRWGFDQYVFVPRDCPSHIKDEVVQDDKILFVDKGECKLRPYVQVIKTIYREDNTPVFQLVEANKESAINYFKKQENLKLK